MPPPAQDYRKQRAIMKAVLQESKTVLDFSFLFNTAKTIDPIAEDVIVRIEVAPPSAHPHPLLSTGAFEAPERVQIHFYAHRDQPTSDAANTPVIFFIHGGKNVADKPTSKTFIPFYTQLMRASHSGKGNFVLIAPIYRLVTASKSTYPAALQDLVAAYDYVLSRGYNPSNITIAGNSTGGSHAVVLTHLILQSDRAPPRRIMSMAPDAISFDGLSDLTKANASTGILDAPRLKMYSKWDAGDLGTLADPLISVAYIPFAASWPKTLILVGTENILNDESHELAERISALDLAVELVENDYLDEWWDMPQVFAREFEDVAQKIAQFVL